MNATYRVRDGLTIEVEAATQKELFEQLAGIAEVFGETACGLCGSTELYPVYRHVSQGKRTFEYPEWACRHCHARLSLGCRMEGGVLFPHRRLDKSGRPNREKETPGKHNGWTHYKGQPVDEPTAPAKSPPTTPASITADEWKQLQSEAKSRGIASNVLLAFYGVNRPRDFPADKLADAMQRVQAGKAAFNAVRA